MRVQAPGSVCRESCAGAGPMAWKSWCVWFVCVACVYARVTCVLKHSGCRIRFGSGACCLLGFVAVDSEPGPAFVCGTWWKSPPGACAHPVEWLRESLWQCLGHGALSLAVVGASRLGATVVGSSPWSPLRFRPWAWTAPVLWAPCPHVHRGDRLERWSQDGLERAPHSSCET